MFQKTLNLSKTIGIQFFLPAEKGIDWDIATGIALEAAEQDKSNYKQYQEIYEEIISILDPVLTDLLKFQPDTHIPLVYNRESWIVTTIESIKQIFGEIIDEYWNILEESIEKSPTSKITKKTTKSTITAEIGLLTGYLSNKVLAQYDLLIPNRQNNFLYFIEPNIQKRQQQLGVDGATFRFWITLHELAHKYQFEQNPWIKNYYFSLIEESKNIMHQPVKNKSSTGSMTLILSPSNLQLITKIQAFMSVIEGFAEYVMFEAAKKLPYYNETAPLFKRRKTGGTLKNIFEKMIGFDLKLNQYKSGYNFISYIADKKGIEFINKNLVDSKSIPSLDEIKEPQSWLNRISSI